MGEVNTSQWIQFFRNAGMSLNMAANYAIIFYDNRIQLDMLMDLSKEYLFDMGIKVMGDVIAILRHAKVYHNQMAKEKMIGGQPMMPTSTPKTNQNSPTTRMLTHYTRPSSVSPRKTAPVSQRGQSVSTIQRRSPAAAAPAKRSLVSLSRAASQEVLPVKKARFIQPQQQQQEEKSMLVRMPSGTTDRSRKLLQLQQQVQSAKRSVFDRLGDSHVSSSTDIKLSRSQSSIFRRLGPSSSTEVTSTAGKFDDNDHGPLQYRGILKKLSTVRPITTRVMQKNSPLVKTAASPGKKIVRLNTSSATSTMRSSVARRTVVQSARDLQASNVTQINKILAQDMTRRTSPLRVQNFKPILGLQSTKGTNRLTVGNRISLMKKQQQQVPSAQKIITVRGGGKVVALKNNPTSRFALNSRQSVFNRLGKK